MPDHLFLSVWLKRFDDQGVLDAFRKVLEDFPYSSNLPGIRYISVHPLDWSEPAALEQEFAGGADAAYVLGLVAEFQHPDCAYQAAAFWDLEESPQRVELIAYGPQFEDRDEERGHVEIDLGLETPFLSSQANVSKLISLVRTLTARLPVARRQLWTESGENFAEKIAGACDAGGSQAEPSAE